MVPPAAAWHYLQWPHYNASCIRMDHSIAAGGWWWECTAPFLVLVTLTFDLDIQTRRSEGPNTSSLWIWCKSFQPFPRYDSQTKKTNKKVTDSAKNRTLRSLLREVIIFELEAKHVLPSIRKLHADRRKGRKMPFFVSSDLDLWPRPSDSSKRGTKHVFHVNLAQSIQRFPGYFTHKQKPQTAWRLRKHNLPQFAACVKNHNIGN